MLRRLFYVVIVSLLGLVAQPADAQSGDESAVLAIVNQERANVGESPLAWDVCLAEAARRHNEDMIANGFFSHTGSDGSSAGQRARDAGSPSTFTGENIAFGYTSPESVMNAWMNSSGHRANILRSGFTHIGISRVNNHWTQVFGNRACSGVTGGGTTDGGTTDGGTTDGGTTDGGTTDGGSGGGGTTDGGTTDGGTTDGGSTDGGTTDGASIGEATVEGNDDSDDDDDNGSSASTSSATSTSSCGGDVQMSGATNGVFCRSVAAAGVGNQEVLNMGMIRAVDVSGNFGGAVQVCLSGVGRIMFMSAAMSPRMPVPVPSFDNGNGTTCASITGPGTVVLVNGQPDSAAPPQQAEAVPSQPQAQQQASTGGPATVHIVQPGENLFRIGLRYGVPYQELAALNGIGSDYRIDVGQEIRIPAR